MAAFAQGHMGFGCTGNPIDAAAAKPTTQLIRRELERITTERMATDPALFFLDG